MNEHHRIRVLEVLPSLKRAGAERMATSLACGLDPLHFEVRVVAMFDPSPGGFESVLAEHDIPAEHLSKSSGLDLRMIPRMRRIFRQFEPHIIHTHSYLLRYAVPAHAGLRQGTIVHTVHNVAKREVDLAGRMLHRIAFRMGVQPVAVGEEVERSFRKVYGFDVTATIPNGIDIERFRQPDVGANWRRLHGFTPDDRLAVAVARLEPQKNPIGAVDAFADALRNHPNWHLLLAGDGTMREQTASRAEELGLAHRIHLLGVRDDITEILTAADIFLLASHWEGNPLSVMEAIAAGLPVVATAVGGIPQLVETGSNGILVEPNSREQLAAAIASLAGDDAMREAYRQDALRRAPSFAVETMVASYAKLFVQIREGQQ